MQQSTGFFHVSAVIPSREPLAGLPPSAETDVHRRKRSRTSSVLRSSTRQWAKRRPRPEEKAAAGNKQQQMATSSNVRRERYKVDKVEKKKLLCASMSAFAVTVVSRRHQLEHHVPFIGLLRTVRFIFRPRIVPRL